MKPEPRIIDVLTTGVNVQVTYGIGQDGEVYLLDEKGRPMTNGQGGYKTASPAIAAQVKASIKRADDFGKGKVDFIRPDAASIPDKPQED